MAKIFDKLAFLKKRKQDAEHLLDNDAFQHAITDIKQDYLDEFIRSPVKASDDRERIYTALRMLGEIENKLRTYISEAKFEQSKQK